MGIRGLLFEMIRNELRDLIESVCRGNVLLKNEGLVVLTWGNVSAIDRAQAIVAIKPSGVDYSLLKKDDIVLTDLNGKVIESQLHPSSDLQTHLALYKAFPEIGAVVHTHSTYATAFAQACQSLPCLGTTHADYFHGEIPVTDTFSRRDVESDYETHTGEMIVRKLRQLKINPMHCPSIFVANHGPFSWGETAAKALENAVVLEEVCKIAWLTSSLSDRVKPIQSFLLDKHYLRKHGKESYYGQQGERK